MSARRRLLAPALVLAAAPAPAALAQDGSAFLHQARALTEPRFVKTFERTCASNPPPLEFLGRGTHIEPVRLFDDLSYIGRTDVGVFVLETSGGLVLIDTLYTPEDVETMIVPDMRKLGLDPADIRLVLISHSHRDHAGGAPYFRDRGVRVMAPAADWPAMGGAPDAQSELRDGQEITVGDTRIAIVDTAGHTPGTITIVFPVTDKGRPHMAAMMGAVGPRGGIEPHRIGLAGMERLLAAARARSIDVGLHPHPHADDSLAILQAARTRPASEPNPFVLGTDGFRRFTEMVAACLKARIAAMEAGG